jgi:hypothetical protein
MRWLHLLLRPTARQPHRIPEDETSQTASRPPALSASVRPVGRKESGAVSLLRAMVRAEYGTRGVPACAGLFAFRANTATQRGHSPDNAGIRLTCRRESRRQALELTGESVRRFRL